MMTLLLALALVQEKAAEEKPVSPPEPVWKTALKQVTLGGQVRFRGEYRDPTAYANLPASRDDDDVFLSRIRLNLTLTVDDEVEVFFQPQDQRTFGDEASVASDENNLDVHQGYVDVRRLLDQPLSLRVGRQELHYGDGRLVSPLEWSNIGRAWDGLKVRWAPGGATVDAFYTVIKEGTGAEDDQDFFGLYASCAAVEAHEFDVYVLGRRFNDNSVTAETGETGDLRDVTVGARVKGKAAGFDYSLEMTVEF